MSDLLRRPGPPEPVPHVDPPRVQDPRLSEVVGHDARLVSLYDQATFSQGRVWQPARKGLVWSDVEGRRVLGWHPDGRTLYVSDTSRTHGGDGHTIYAFPVGDGAGDEHTLGERRVLAHVEPGIPDGFRVDSRGWVRTGSGAGGQRLSAEGHRLGPIPTPQRCSNCCFGPGERRLYIASMQHRCAFDLAGAD